MFRKSSPPIDPRRRDAPMTATLPGSKNGRSDSATATWSRSSTRSRYVSVDAIGNSDLDLAAFELAGELEAGGLEDAEHVAVVGHHLGDEALDTDIGRAIREPLQQPRADPSPLMLVRDRERRLRETRVAQPHVVADGDHRLRPFSSVPSSAPRSSQSGSSSGSTSRGADRREAVEAEVEALLGERAEEVEKRLRVLPPRRTQPERAAVPEDDVDRLRGSRHRRRVCGCEHARSLSASIVPFGLPTFSSPPGRGRHAANAWLTNG